MADHEKKITLTDLQQKIPSNDLYNDVSDNAGVDAWIDGAITGKLNNCWKRMRTEWTTKLMDDESFTDAIPSILSLCLEILASITNLLSSNSVSISITFSQL